MTLTAKDVAEITRLLEESDFDELYLETDGLKLTVRRHGATPLQGGGPAFGPAGRAHESTVDPQPAGEQGGAAQPGERALPVRGSPPPDESLPNRHTVTAPMLGTFYRAPKPGAPPFVEIGSDVVEDTIIGIIEVMKLMNTVRAGARGRVLEILAQDGGMVEYGQPLLRLETGPRT
ncbi:MAG TPA: biotin/lipoyl-containing protein [Steroidobacteraceae bacterium]|nr:biotin/lipoyl-containing protein [Steroidobacteraceae bacterium]